MNIYFYIESNIHMNNLKNVYKYLFENRLSNSKKLCTLFGPAGSGKSTLANSIKHLGVKHSTPDDFIEHLLKKEYPDESFTDIFRNHDTSKIRNKSLDLASKRLKVWTSSDIEHIIMDGTGAGHEDWYKNEIYIPFSNLNFKTLIAILYVPMEISIQNDIRRGESGNRSLGSDIVSHTHNGLMKSIPQYKKIADELEFDFIIIRGYYNHNIINEDDESILNSNCDYIYTLQHGIKYIENFYIKE